MPMSDRAARIAYNREYYQKNRERMLAEQKARTTTRKEAQPGELERYQREYQATHKDVLLEKQRVRSKANYASNKAAYRARQRRARLTRYGLDSTQEKAILTMQGHECPICLRFLTEAISPSIDHCHVSGSVRGILCRRCNAALGMLEESPANLERALEYLSLGRAQTMTKLLSGVTSTPNKMP